MGRSRKRDFFVCPHCGAEVPQGAISCRECGSDDETGWSESAGEWEENVASPGYGSDDDFDYDEFIANEFPGHGRAPAPGGRWTWTIVVTVVTLAFLLWALARFGAI